LTTAENAVADAAVSVRDTYGKYCKVADNKCDRVAANITTLDLDIAGKAQTAMPLGRGAGYVPRSRPSFAENER
jgi:hypothetical protein